MTKNQWLMKPYNLILHTDKFLLARPLLKPSSMVITNPDFFKRITSKYRISRRWQARFPTLVFPLSTHALIMKHSFLQRTDLPAPIAHTVTRDRGDKDQTSHTISPQNDLVRAGARFTHPEVRLLRYESLSALRTQPVFSKTSSMVTDARSKKPEQSLAEIASSGSYPLGKGMPWAVEHKPITQEKHGITPLGIQSPTLYQAIPLSADPDRNRQKLRMSAASHEAFEGSKGRTPSAGSHPLPDSAVPSLRYHTPLNIAMDELKKSIASVEKKVAEGERVIEKTPSDNLHLSDRESDTTRKINVDLTHLTDQLYRMLERKIRAERERRGLNG